MKLYSTRFLAGLLLFCWLEAPSFAAARLLAIVPDGEPFRQALEGLKTDLGEKYQVQRFDAGCDNAADSLRRTIRAFSPQGLVLMDSKAILLVRELQKGDSGIPLLPKFVLMTLKVDGAIQGLGNVTGIRFEVPAYTIFTNLNILSGNEIHKIGVFYRKSFSGFVEESKRFLAKEKLELVGECLDCGSGGNMPPSAVSKKLKEGMTRLATQKVEVIWMLADNVLVNETTIREFWLTRFKEYGLPVVVPVPNLASLELNLGMFGVWPDYHQLGMQAAQQVIQVFESGESPVEIGLEPLISVQTVINLEVAKRVKWPVKGEKLYRVTSVLKKN